MVQLFLILSAAVAFTNAAEDEALKAKWNGFKTKYGRNYKSAAEEEEKYKIFIKNSQYIEDHNKKFANGESSYELAINMFGDMSKEEWKSVYSCVFGEIEDDNAPIYEPPKNSEKSLPQEVDWRKHGVVTDVKDQDGCGACWAFATTGAVEGQHAKKTGKLVSLSEQNLVDCTVKFGNAACKGGYPLIAYRYIISNGGIDTEKSYPYEARNSTCRFKKEDIGATLRNYSRVKPTEADLAVAVANAGPVAVMISTGTQEFHHYKQGILDIPNCPKIPDHVVLIVGYGVQNGKKYWILKNSWGTNWGMKGYGLLARDKGNQCGIADRASFPIV